MSLTELLERSYLPSRLGASAGHAKQARYAIAVFGRWLQREAMIDDLPQVGQFLCCYAESHSAQTVNSKRAYLLALWRHAHKHHGAAPPAEIRRAPTRLDPPECWTVDEIARIIQACERCRGFVHGIRATYWMRSLILAAYDTGCRVGQLLQTRMADLDLDGPWIVLRAGCAKDYKGRVRELSLQTCAAIRLIWGERELVWPWGHSSNALQGRIRHVLRVAGVAYGRGRGGNFHKLRRTSGTLVEAAGGDGARHLGNSRKIFETHYLDSRVAPNSQLLRLPRPQF